MKNLALLPAFRQIRGMPAPSTIIFDLDDTLIETTPVYDEVIHRFAGEVAALFPGLALADILALQEEIDVRAAETAGFGKDRFPSSLAETYRVLAQRCGAPVEAGVESRFTELGYSVFERTPALVDGARELLGMLKGRVELLLYTLGVPEVQQVKVESHALDQVFDEVHIVPRKSVEQLRAIVGARPPERVMVVGDSLRGEIAPALALGCRAVLVRRIGGWSYHDTQVSGSYHSIDRLLELRELVELSPVLESA